MQVTINQSKLGMAIETKIGGKKLIPQTLQSHTESLTTGRSVQLFSKATRIRERLLV